MKKKSNRTLMVNTNSQKAAFQENTLQEVFSVTLISFFGFPLTEYLPKGHQPHEIMLETLTVYLGGETHTKTGQTHILLNTKYLAPNFK